MRGRLDEGIAHLRRAVDLDPRNLRARFALVQEIERSGGQNADAQAQKELEELLELEPDNLAVLLERTRLAAKRGDARVASRFGRAARNASGSLACPDRRALRRPAARGCGAGFFSSGASRRLSQERPPADSSLSGGPCQGEHLGRTDRRAVRALPETAFAELDAVTCRRGAHVQPGTDWRGRATAPGPRCWRSRSTAAARRRSLRPPAPSCDESTDLKSSCRLSPPTQPVDARVSKRAAGARLESRLQDGPGHRGPRRHSAARAGRRRDVLRRHGEGGGQRAPPA